MQSKTTVMTTASYLQRELPTNEVVGRFNKTTGLDVSSRYKVINTADILQAFADAGFELHRVRTAGVLKSEKDGFQRHVMIFRHKDLTLPLSQGAMLELRLTNSYDGSCAYRLALGIFRQVCSNGLVVGKNYESIRVVHVGQNAIQTAIQGAFRIAKQAQRIAASIEAMRARELTADERFAFARKAAELIAPSSVVQVDVETLLEARRMVDVANDLWTVFNRIQENVVRGGLKYTSVNEQGNVRHNTSRAIKSISRENNVNQELWDIAETFLQKVG